MDPRQRLALGGDSDDESPFKAAPEVAANKIARYSGQPRKSKLEREKEAEAERQRKEEEEAARAYREFVEAFGGDEETGPSTGARPGSSRIKTVGKGFVRAGGAEKYNPLARGGAASAGPSSAPAMAGVPTGPRIPTGPRAMMQGAPSAPAAPVGPASKARPTAASLMGGDDEVRVSTAFAMANAGLTLIFAARDARQARTARPQEARRRQLPRAAQEVPSLPFCACACACGTRLRIDCVISTSPSSTLVGTRLLGKNASSRRLVEVRGGPPVPCACSWLTYSRSTVGASVTALAGAYQPALLLPLADSSYRSSSRARTRPHRFVRRR